jgi:hypothetical protein
MSNEPTLGAFAIPLNTAEAVWNLGNDIPIEFPRAYLGKLVAGLDRWCEHDVDIDVKLDGLRAFITPRKCVLTREGFNEIGTYSLRGSSA